MNVPAEQSKQMPDKKRARITVEDMLRAKAPDLSAMLGPDQSLDRFIAAVANQVVKEPRIASVPLDVTMLEVGPYQPKVIEDMVEGLAGNRHAETAQIGEVGQAEPAGFMRLAEDHLLLFAVNGPP